MRSAQGVSTNSDTATAVKEAVQNALENLKGGSDIFAALIFWGSVHQAEVIATTFQSLLPEKPVIGASTDGEITGQGLSVDSVVVFLMASPNIKARTAAAAPLSNKNSFEGGKLIASRLKSDLGRFLILLPDGLTGNGTQVIKGAQEVLGQNFVIAGGTAGDRGQFKQTWQLRNGKAYSGALVGMILESERPLDIGFGVMSGWRPIGISKMVTEAEGNIVYKIENETALDVYRTFLGDKASQLPAIGVEYPFGLVDESGVVNERGLRAGEEYLLMRAPMSVDTTNGSIQFAAEIPKGAKIKMTRAKSTDIIEASKEAASRAIQKMQGKPEAVFFFSCMARKVVLGRKTNQEIEAAQEVFGRDIPMIGFYTYGEIANCGEENPICRFHNETATFLAIRENA
ncbi:MAG: FIST C-terminal domain-containing protein [Turneriella sp.]|nr:FIST C-terminal domain-containing protein [Turneriella sp.]